MSQSNLPKTLTIAGGACLVVALAVLATWVALGAHPITQYQVETIVVEEDEFGDEMERAVMQDEFRFGLLPDKGYDAAAPLMAVFGGLGLVLLFVARRKSSNEEQADDTSAAPDGEP